MWLRNISQHTIHMSITGGKYGKSSYTGPVHLYGVYRDCGMGDSCSGKKLWLIFSISKIYIIRRVHESVDSFFNFRRTLIEERKL